jgi:DUF1365 family protein
MALANGLLFADVSHTRLYPKRHALRYKVYYLCFPTRLMQDLACKLLSLSRFNLFSFYPRDYGFKEQRGEAWVRSCLAEQKITEADGDIVLITLPRVLGYAFNPVSFWFCLDKERRPRAVMAEVNNTFGERHGYVCAHHDHRVIEKDDWLRSDKQFHVSPFLKVRGEYHFRFAYSEDKIGVWIDYYDDGQKMLLTSVVGKRQLLSDKQLLIHFLCYPMITFKVIALIHYHALKLVLKGIKYNNKPAAPLKDIS